MHGGHKIYFVTANPASRKVIKAKLSALNLDGYKKLLQVKGKTDVEIGKNKGDLCTKYKLSIFFDNNPDVIKGIAMVSEVALVQVMDDSELPKTEKKAAVSCPCLGEVRSNDLFVPVRCFHCPDFLESPFDKVVHKEKHHPA